MLPTRNITIPAENLSSKLYMPKTNAPVFAFEPTTSEIKLMPVESTIVWETPMDKHECTYKCGDNVHHPSCGFSQQQHRA